MFPQTKTDRIIIAMRNNDWNLKWNVLKQYMRNDLPTLGRNDEEEENQLCWCWLKRRLLKQAV